MRPAARAYVRSQGGYTLVEVIISIAIASIVMGALTSVIFTSVRVTDVASSRVEASAQIRNFQFFAYDDFARSQVQNAGACTPGSPCTTQPIVLAGSQASNSSQPVPAPYQVTYAWDGGSFVDRQVAPAGSTSHAATDVSDFSWYVDSSGPFPKVVIHLTITVGTYSESQTLLFYPRLNP